MTGEVADRSVETGITGDEKCYENKSR